MLSPGLRVHWPVLNDRAPLIYACYCSPPSHRVFTRLLLGMSFFPKTRSLQTKKPLCCAQAEAARVPWTDGTARTTSRSRAAKSSASLGTTLTGACPVLTTASFSSTETEHRVDDDSAFLASQESMAANNNSFEVGDFLHAPTA